VPCPWGLAICISPLSAGGDLAGHPRRRHRCYLDELALLLAWTDVLDWPAGSAPLLPPLLMLPLWLLLPLWPLLANE